MLGSSALMSKPTCETTERLLRRCETFTVKVNEGSLNGLSPISGDIYNPVMIVQRPGVSVRRRAGSERLSLQPASQRALKEIIKMK